MSRRSLRHAVLLAAVGLVDALIVFDAFSVAYLLRFRLHLFAYEYLEPAPLGEYLKAIVVVVYFWLLLFYIFGLYDFSRYRSTIDIFHLVTKAVTFGTVIILSLTYFYREFSFSRLVCVYAWVLAVVLFSLFRVAIQLFRAEWYRRGHDHRTVLAVGSRTLARFLLEKIRDQPELGYRVVGVVDSEEASEAVAGVPYLGSVGAIDRVLGEHPADLVLIAHPALGHFDLLEVIQVCERRDVSIRMVPPTYDLQVNYHDIEEIDGIPVVSINEKVYRRAGDLAKRGMDLAIALPGLLLTLPLWAVIALAVRAEDGGPVFFRQRRVGRDGTSFFMWKFRTMVADAERQLAMVVDVPRLAEPVFKLERDPRVTRVGRFLRRSSLDELPQLLNVLRGEMSLVGPRPEEEKLVSLYNVWERRRLKATPGITGLQQIMCRGSKSLRERVMWDVLYVRKRSLLLDLWILLRTLWTVARGRGAH